MALQAADMLNHEISREVNKGPKSMSAPRRGYRAQTRVSTLETLTVKVRPEAEGAETRTSP